MKYQELFGLEIINQYYEDDFQHVVIVPDDATTHFLSRPNLLTKTTKAGIIVWVKTPDEKEELTQVTSEETLRFTIFPVEASFSTFTDIQLPTGQVALFSNEALEVGEEVLKRSQTGGGEKLDGIPPVGKVELNLSKISSGEGAQTPYYQAVFPPRSTKWRYYLVANPGTTDLSIEDRGQQLEFNELDIPQDLTDPIAYALRVNFPDTELVVFESTQSIAGTKKGIKNLQLLQNGHLLIRHLPNPAPLNDGVKIIQIR